ncbi:hypothetical protein KJZ63_00760 [Patescibacteria group bacterium]|nr:hypothetical protein [Patescibacteria group bacterium]
MKVRLLLATIFAIFLLSPKVAHAQLGSKAGIHILHPGEVKDAVSLLKTNNDDWHYLTIPLPLSDLNKVEEWKSFFEQSKVQKFIPIVRLVTKFENGSWQRPTRKDIIEQFKFLSQFEWPIEERLIIIFNEPNHAPEFGGSIDPREYARVLRFAADWAHTENKNYKVLPAGLDLAAPNSRSTMEAFNFLDQMYEEDQEIFSVIDYWNSHSYPNPGFISSPYQTGKNSLSGFKYELAYIKKISGKDLPVYITETGWLSNSLTNRWLESYYRYAALHIWSDSRVKAVTPFILHGDPGPFAGFSFLDRENLPTKQFQAYQKTILTVPSQ